MKRSHLTLRHYSPVCAISWSDLDSSKHAVFKGCSNPNMAENQKKKHSQKKIHIIKGLLRWTHEFGEAGMNDQLKIFI